MLTKEYISETKIKGNGAMLALVNSIANDEKNILFLLNNLGRLPENFDDSWIKNLLSSRNDKIRLNAVKNIGKASSTDNIKILYKIALDDSSTAIRREAVSSIGRMRSAKTINYLSNLLDDSDPKIASQAIHQFADFFEHSPSQLTSESLY